MRVVETVWASYRLLFANFGAFARAGLRWSLLVAATSASGQITTAAALPDDNMYLIKLAPYLLSVVIGMAGSISFGIVWHRFIILSESPQRIFPSSVDVIGPYSIRATAAMAAPLCLWALVTWGYWDREETLVDLLAWHIGGSLLLTASAPLLLVLPASAVGDIATTVGKSWQATRRHAFALCLGLIACDLPLTAAILFVDLVGYEQDYYSAEATVALVATLLLDFARNALWTIYMSLAYLELIRPKQTQIDHFS